MKRARLVTLSLGLFLVAGEAAAVVGRPLTPLSYAGVARRTTRRAAYAGAAAHGGYYGAPGAHAYVTALPTGCASVVSAGVTYHRCGGTYYRPAYDGPNLVYVESAPP